MTWPSVKPCARCGVEKPLEDFTPHARGKYGRVSYCRPCNAEYVRLRNSSPEARAKKAAYQRERRSDPDSAAAGRATSKAWKERNPERAKAHYGRPEKLLSNIEWNRRNPERRREAAKRYQAAHPAIRQVTQQRRRARLTGVDSTLTQAEWLQILADFNHRCGYCLRADRPLQQEHLTPLSKGGAHTAENVIPSCGPCNYKKHTRNLLQFLAVGGMA